MNRRQPSADLRDSRAVAKRITDDYGDLGETERRAIGVMSDVVRVVDSDTTASGGRGSERHESEVSGLAFDAEALEVLTRCSRRVEERLDRFGKGPDRFGPVHADMRLANLLVNGDDVTVIDFDDCGLSWFMYDLGSALSFIEHEPYVPELVDSWVTGYRTVAELSAADETELPTFIMLRRMLLVAWIGSHIDTETAQSMGAEYTSTSCQMAEEYLGRTF
jgi:Ser/Thr protein kinase RdoA (MazF antagonist)